MHRDARVGMQTRRWLRTIDVSTIPAPLVAALLALADQADQIAEDCAADTRTLGHMLPAIMDRIVLLTDRITEATTSEGLWDGMDSL